MLFGTIQVDDLISKVLKEKAHMLLTFDPLNIPEDYRLPYSVTITEA